LDAHPKSSRLLPSATIGAEPLALVDFLDLAHGRALPRLDPSVQARMSRSYELVRERLEEGQVIYGVTTGYGASVKNRVPPASSAQLSLNLLRFHGCGTGRLLTPTESAAVLTARLCSLARGGSGVRPFIVERLVEMLERRILPAIPAEGSVGASGDLTPLSYVAAVMVGEREVLKGENGTEPAAEALAAHRLAPLTLEAKEALALMNGTAVATALGVLAHGRARRLSRLAARVTALSSWAISGNPEHFDPVIHEAKGHPGQMTAAAWIREDLQSLPHIPTVRLQDRYSIRCAPQVLGVLVDALDWFEKVLATELNSVSDNPIIAPERGAILHGGNFYGGHVVFAMDGLKTAVANIADLLDRQILLLCSPSESGGLAENLVGVSGDDTHTHHGFKGMSITASALAAEALKHSIPASIFSRSTEAHNQDKVPMATIGARDALRVVELAEQVTAVAILAACQAADLRDPGGKRGGIREAVRRRVPRLNEDRRMDRDIDEVLAMLRDGELDPSEARLP
jgi:histidine ammonia-lyase